MARLIITADIHGSYSAWEKITGDLTPTDCLAIAGDLFDTVYGSDGHPDFQPELIKKELKSLPCKYYYVYGNCDSSSFFKKQEMQLAFKFEKHTFLLNHGHFQLPDLSDFDIIIEGHSHIARLETIMGKVFLNPGSPVFPRKNGPTYSVFENQSLKIIDVENNKILKSLELKTFISP